MLTSQNLNSFLTLGYFLGYPGKKIITLPEVDTRKYEDFNRDELIKIGSEILMDAFAENFKPNARHLIPLSGGFDSRAILGALLKFTDSSNISTFTYGIPGALDFEIGNMIAKEYGTNHLCIDFNNVQFSRDMLGFASKRFGGQTMLFFHPDHKELEAKFHDHVYWSGFFGDCSGGYYITPMYDSFQDIESAGIAFLKNERYVRSTYLGSEPIENLFQLLDGLNINNSILNHYERLSFYNRQTKYIAPHKCPDGFEVKTPFLIDKWLKFSFSIPNKFRKNSSLYQSMLLYSFPDLFILPNSHRFGLSMNSSELRYFMRRLRYKLFSKTKAIRLKRTNYFDINDFIRNNESLRQIITESLAQLRGRDILPWLNPEDMLKKHMSGKADYGDALQVLASLEIILSSENEIS
ncbi:MAG: hypothetical protein JW894_09695 [Bacteroidales bacterium]|nr:hypothetical protein [Bacteroidales bacterium]